MTFQPIPDTLRSRWRRLDVRGCEQACIERTDTGWRVAGELDVEEAGVAAHIRYDIACDTAWHTRSARVECETSGALNRIALTADGAGCWMLEGRPLPALWGALDIDLGFTPATNFLPIRRLGLAVGESASVRTAWLRFPALRLEPLEQTYTRETELSFRYCARVDGELYLARLDADVFGRVVRYEGLWELEPPAR